MPSIRKWIVTALLFGSSCTSSFAALISETHAVFGQPAVVDTEQNLVWLSPSITVGLSYSEVSNLLIADTRFTGFRWASVLELESLFTHAGIPDINVPGYGAYYGTSGNVAGVIALQSLLGTTYSVHSNGVRVAATAGFVGTSFRNPINRFESVYIGDITVREDVLTTSGLVDFASASTTWSSIPIGTQVPNAGAWLVASVSSVPEPSTVVMLALGLAMLASTRKSIGGSGSGKE